jgi:hypothetical protein
MRSTSFEVIPSARCGRRLFPSLPSYARLKRVSVRTYDPGVVFLHYEPQRDV